MNNTFPAPAPIREGVSAAPAARVPEVLWSWKDGGFTLSTVAQAGGTTLKRCQGGRNKELSLRVKGQPQPWGVRRLGEGTGAQGTPTVRAPLLENKEITGDTLARAALSGARRRSGGHVIRAGQTCPRLRPYGEGGGGASPQVNELGSGPRPGHGHPGHRIPQLLLGPRPERVVPPTFRLPAKFSVSSKVGRGEGTAARPAGESSTARSTKSRGGRGQAGN